MSTNITGGGQRPLIPQPAPGGQPAQATQLVGTTPAITATTTTTSDASGTPPLPFTQCAGGLTRLAAACQRLAERKGDTAIDVARVFSRIHGDADKLAEFFGHQTDDEPAATALRNTLRAGIALAVTQAVALLAAAEPLPGGILAQLLTGIRGLLRCRSAGTITVVEMSNARTQQLVGGILRHLASTGAAPPAWSATEIAAAWTALMQLADQWLVQSFEAFPRAIANLAAMTSRQLDEAPHDWDPGHVMQALRSMDQFFARHLAPDPGGDPAGPVVQARAAVLDACAAVIFLIPDFHDQAWDVDTVAKCLDAVNGVADASPPAAASKLVARARAYLLRLATQPFQIAPAIVTQIGAIAATVATTTTTSTTTVTATTTTSTTTPESPLSSAEAATGEQSWGARPVHAREPRAAAAAVIQERRLKLSQIDSLGDADLIRALAGATSTQLAGASAQQLCDWLLVIDCHAQPPDAASALAALLQPLLKSCERAGAAQCLTVLLELGPCFANPSLAACAPLAGAAIAVIAHHLQTRPETDALLAQLPPQRLRALAFALAHSAEGGGEHSAAARALLARLGRIAAGPQWAAQRSLLSAAELDALGQVLHVGLAPPQLATDDAASSAPSPEAQACIDRLSHFLQSPTTATSALVETPEQVAAALMNPLETFMRAPVDPAGIAESRMPYRESLRRAMLDALAFVIVADVRTAVGTQILRLLNTLALQHAMFCDWPDSWWQTPESRALILADALQDTLIHADEHGVRVELGDLPLPGQSAAMAQVLVRAMAIACCMAHPRGPAPQAFGPAELILLFGQTLAPLRQPQVQKEQKRLKKAQQKKTAKLRKQLATTATTATATTTTTTASATLSSPFAAAGTAPLAPDPGALPAAVLDLTLPQLYALIAPYAHHPQHLLNRLPWNRWAVFLVQVAQQPAATGPDTPKAVRAFLGALALSMRSANPPDPVNFESGLVSLVSWAHVFLDPVAFPGCADAVASFIDAAATLMRVQATAHGSLAKMDAAPMGSLLNHLMSYAPAETAAPSIAKLLGLVAGTMTSAQWEPRRKALTARHCNDAALAFQWARSRLDDPALRTACAAAADRMGAMVPAITVAQAVVWATVYGATASAASLANFAKTIARMGIDAEEAGQVSFDNVGTIVAQVSGRAQEPEVQDVLNALARWVEVGGLAPVSLNHPRTLNALLHMLGPILGKEFRPAQECTGVLLVINACVRHVVKDCTWPADWWRTAQGCANAFLDLMKFFPNKPTNDRVAYDFRPEKQSTRSPTPPVTAVIVRALAIAVHLAFNGKKRATIVVAQQPLRDAFDRAIAELKAATDAPSTGAGQARKKQ